jgi:hypothetical protein
MSQALRESILGAVRQKEEVEARILHCEVVRDMAPDIEEARKGLI